VSQIVGRRVLGDRPDRLGIDVQRHDARRSGACGCKRENAGSGTYIGYVFSRQIEVADEVCEKLARDKPAWVKNGGVNYQPEARDVDGFGPAPFKNKMKRKEVDRFSKKPSCKYIWSIGSNESALWRHHIAGCVDRCL
jgi:hypothetical protein